MDEQKMLPLTVFTVAQMIAGMDNGPFTPKERKSKFYTKPPMSKPHNYPEPREHTHGLEPKPRPARKVFREKLRNGETPECWLQEEQEFMSKCKEQEEEEDIIENKQ